MNKKLFLMTSLVAIALATSSMYSATYASNDDLDDEDETTDTSVDSDDHDSDDDTNDDDRYGRKERRADKKEMKNTWKTEKKSFNEQRKENRKELHELMRKQLDETTREQVEHIRETYEPKFVAVKENSPLTADQKKTEIKTLHDAMHAEIKAILPTDLQDDFDAIKSNMRADREAWLAKKDEMKQEWKSKKDEWKAKREERRQNMKGKVRVVFGKLDNVLSKFEANKTPEQLIAKYTTIIQKLDEKIATIEEGTDLHTFLKSLSDDLKDRIAELQAE